MKRFIVCMLLLMLPLASAVMVPIDYTIEVDFDGPKDFTLYLPHGYEKYFNWEGNETHSDEVFTSKLFYEFNDSQYCPSYINYLNLTNSYINVVNTCNQLLAGFNSSFGFNGVMWEVEFDRLAKEENKSLTWLTKYEACDIQYEQCTNQLASFQAATEELSICKDDLAKQKSSSNTTNMYWGAGGIILGYLLWGRKKRIGPSEQVEMGSGGDDVEPRD